MTTHTPGPWAYSRHTDYDAMIEASGVGIASILLANDNAGIEPGEDEANARLIAAAPDLLEALRHIQNGMLDQKGCIAVARAAIAKAIKGE